MRISDWSSDVCSSDLSASCSRSAVIAVKDSLAAVSASFAASCCDCRSSRRSRFAEKISCSALRVRSEEHTSELQSLMRISYAVFCLNEKKSHREKTDMPAVHTASHTVYTIPTQIQPIP